MEVYLVARSTSDIKVAPSTYIPSLQQHQMFPGIEHHQPAGINDDVLTTQSMSNCSQAHRRLARHRVTVISSNDLLRLEQAVPSNLIVEAS